MSKQIVVTGAAGFIGCNLVAELNARGWDDLILVDSPDQDDKSRNLLGLRFADVVEPDLFLTKLEKNEFGEIDAIIHLGACSSTTERDAEYLLRNNTHYTRTLCEWSLKHGARFIYASSAATYGDGGQGYKDDEDSLESLHALNLYGHSKHLFDLWARENGWLSRIAGLKYFNVFGPHEEHKGDMRSMVSKAYRQIKNTGKVELFKSYRPDYEDGEQKRDFIYVKDAVAVTLHFLENRDVNGLFNCGTGNARSWNDLADAVFAAMGAAPRIEYVEMPEAIRNQYQYFTQAEMAKLRKAGYKKPFTPLEDAVREYVTESLART